MNRLTTAKRVAVVAALVEGTESATVDSAVAGAHDAVVAKFTGNGCRELGESFVGRGPRLTVGLWAFRKEALFSHFGGLHE